MPTISTICTALRDRGFVHLAGLLSPDAYQGLMTELGTVVGTERIALRPGAHAYVAKPGPVPLHTDHPEVDVVAWHCERQDSADGASLLLDARPEVEGLPQDERDLLRSVHLECPPLAGGPPTLRFPVLRASADGEALFCSPWLRSADGNVEHQAALDRFRARMTTAIAASTVEVRLTEGDVLMVDNRRVLHGRRAIAEGSPRRLQRTWLRLRAPLSQAVAG